MKRPSPRAHAGIGAPDLARVVVSAGPGGFTAVRIAVTGAKTIAAASGAELACVPSWRVGSHGLVAPSGRTLMCMASKRERVFTIVFDGPDAERVIGSVGVEEALALAPDCLIADERQPESLLAWARETGVAVVRPVFSPARLLACSLGHPAVEPRAAAPIYPRPPEAVRLWAHRGAPEKGSRDGESV